ncbi:polyketide cyclase [Streptomyces qinglanensis]|uniref:Polyketide cyclase n=1 Tax=Streptomyces qinglanensis TaxID=943816 RepID=A0A1E7K4L8_9ACTN|nr:SRPBCC family protein [Streptomyces qinglanensis]OEU98786.1 polyketide cyclase [Streptomyces qinglanensis]OEV25053.1 polyketide cyclase [Streptomyces nanshensis]
MAGQSEKAKPEEGGPSPLDQLREQFLEFLGAMGKQAVSKVTDRLESVADGGGGLGKLLSGGEGGGALAGAAEAAAKGENPVKAVVKEKAEGAKDKAVGKAKEAVGMDGGSSEAGDLKAINIIEHVDIGRPLRVVYNHFSQFEDFGIFTNGVSNVSVDDEDETTTDWKVRVWPSTRSWKATTLEMVPDERIVWTSEGSKGTTSGAVSFHRLDENLTRVTVVVEYYPSGFFEKLGNIWRAQGRRLRLDLKHFQRYVTLQAEEVEGWRCEIRDGEVVRSHDQVVQEEQQEQDSGDEEPGANEESDQDDGEEEEEDEEEDGEEEDEGRR